MGQQGQLAGVQATQDQSDLTTPRQREAGRTSRRPVLAVVMPDWVEWFQRFSPAHQEPLAYAYPTTFPRILPFLGYNVRGCDCSTPNSRLRPALLPSSLLGAQGTALPCMD